MLMRGRYWSGDAGGSPSSVTLILGTANDLAKTGFGGCDRRWWLSRRLSRNGQRQFREKWSRNIVKPPRISHRELYRKSRKAFLSEHGIFSAEIKRDNHVDLQRLRIIFLNSLSLMTRSIGLYRRVIIINADIEELPFRRQRRRAYADTLGCTSDSIFTRCCVLYDIDPCF